MILEIEGHPLNQPDSELPPAYETAIQTMKVLFGLYRKKMADKKSCCIPHKNAVAMAEAIFQEIEKLTIAGMVAKDDPRQTFRGLIDGLINMTAIMISFSPDLNFKKNTVDRLHSLLNVHNPDIIPDMEGRGLFDPLVAMATAEQEHAASLESLDAAIKDGLEKAGVRVVNLAEMDNGEEVVNRILKSVSNNVSQPVPPKRSKMH